MRSISRQIIHDSVHRIWGAFKKKQLDKKYPVLYRLLMPIVNIGKIVFKRIYKDYALATPYNESYDPLRQYAEWIQNNEIWDIAAIRNDIDGLAYRPKISIITPVYNIEARWLDKCIESVLNQLYDNWELLLHDDGSTLQSTIECLRKWDARDDRIKVSFGNTNEHISVASNHAIQNATGEFIALLDHDDELSPVALYEVVKLLNKNGNADFIYSDEDKVDLDGTRRDPFFKPDWSPDLFFSVMYTCHLGVYRKSVIDAIGGFREGYEGSQDYDLVLRIIERIPAKNIFHIPKILYHWRMIEISTSTGVASKGYALVSARKALAEYFQRRKENVVIHDVNSSGYYIVRREIIGNPLVSIIIPFKDQLACLQKCLDSIQSKTSYDNYEVLLVNNQSHKTETIEYLESIKDQKRFRVIEYNNPFNYSAINNFAVERSYGEYLLFLNNDTEVINDQWLDAMLQHAQREEVGAVGAKLFYPNGKIQHAGVVMGLGVAGHAFKHFNENDEGYFNMLNICRNYSAVTGACLMTRKKIFEQCHGFDNINLPIAYNDVDLCLKMLELGYLIVYTPEARLYHHESLSRGNDAELTLVNLPEYKRFVAEQEFMHNKWKKYIECDPYYNPNLTRVREDFSIDGH